MTQLSYTRLQPTLWVRELRPETRFYKRLGFSVTYEDRNSVSIHYSDAVSFGLYRKPDFQINDSQPLIWRIGVSSISGIYARLMFYYGRQNMVGLPQNQQTGIWVIQYKSPSGYIVVFDGPVDIPSDEPIKTHHPVSYPDTWGYYRHPSGGLSFVHPEDWANWWEFAHHWMFFYCSGQTSDGYLVLNSRDHSWRVRPDYYYIAFAASTFRYGDWVRDKELNRIGQIVGAGWHYNHGSEYYILKAGRRISSKWNWPENLEKVSAPQEGSD